MMAPVRYSPGAMHLIVTDEGVALLGGDLPAALVTRIWTHVGEGRGLAAVLEALTGAFGTSLAAIPPFAVALAEGGSVRLAVRGALTATIETSAGGEAVSGAGVTTWAERMFDGVVRVGITVARGIPEPPELPVRDGVVLASRVDWLLYSGGMDAAPPPANETTGLIEPPVMEPPVMEPPVIEQPAEPGDLAQPDPEQAASADAADSPTRVIDSVPGAGSLDTWLPPEATYAPTVESDAVSSTTGYDHLWGETVVRSVEDAAVRPDDEAEAEAPVVEPVPDGASETFGDHDGETISVAQARALRAADPDSAPPPLAPPRPPAFGRIRLSTGQTLLLDRTVVIGRRPRSTRVTGTDLPHLVAVDSPQQDISRSHLELRAEGDSILATDLHTTNGSTLLRAGAEPVRLHPGEPTVVVPGDVIDLGDDITVSIEDAP
ncbi:FHA domain-containing protein [Microbacterium rhizomatis]|uniref:FHA domain-containing protein n=1 Tax=Microbacterium rhizomatis TaxID=1631477 RepID=A0A5J5IYC9_9MICO|nr:FHA domain-containing protein [Microbacterium rhizomatis]KAA9106455.1 FHA domain-containing protein [Microbacterium rhizomatis]